MRTFWTTFVTFELCRMKDVIDSAQRRFSRWFSVRWESLLPPKGPQKRLAEARAGVLCRVCWSICTAQVELKLGQLLLYEAQRRTLR